MADARTPAELLEFSDDLHSEDVGPLRAFLSARLGEIAAAQPEDSDVRFVAERLARITVSDCVHVADLLGAWDQVVLEGRTGEPGQTQRLRQDIALWWGRLCRTAERFRHHPDHNSRWRPLMYMNLDHAEFMASLSDSAGGVYGDGAHP
ncbi:hypothetical protein [Kitasatospora aureofaciens]|uniref:hypothetical protein n=1 Tax=Kitasatospora aureofaciens TaxID=1894 RepID=UPI001C494F34|nr:hypothetical protein [Kitasatospora aureofaciens]MBV6699986.1 hypothetical protein [Kitasatospora aureofaciens]